MRPVLVLLVATLAFGCGSAGGGTSKSGLRGRVMRGPTMPVCRVGEPCEEPAPGVKLVFYRSGKAVARTTSNKKGRYRIGLAPGQYSVATTGRGSGKVTQPSRVRVPRASFKRVDFHIDTGIR